MIVGIDLGTSTSEVAYLKNGKPVIIPVAGRHGILPSVVAIDPTLRVGEVAERLLAVKPEFCADEVKRLMGSDARVPLAGQEYTPQEVSAMILKHLKTEAESFLGERLDEAVVTVPAYFDDLQRRATVDAAELAGLRVRRLINEPTAAALAYGIERPNAEEKVLVYDLGGGTLDVTVMELSEGILDVLATDGNARLGGKDFDERVEALLIEQCRLSLGVDVPGLPNRDQRTKLRARFRSAAKRAKEDLSSVEVAHVVVPGVRVGEDGFPLDFDYTMTRTALEELIGDLVRSTRRQLEGALAAKDLRPEDIDTVVLVGGSTRIPFVRRFVSDFFGGRPLKTEVPPDEAVAMGAAILSGMEARLIDPDQLVITDVSAFSLGVAVIDEYQGQMTVDTFDPLVKRNQTIPRSGQKHYATVYDGQEAVKIRLYQGEAPLCADNHFIGSVELMLDPPAKASEPIDVSFSYDRSGMLVVVARDPRTGREARHKMLAMPERLSDAERAAAHDRLERLWRDGGAAQPRAAGIAGPSPEPRPTWKESPLYPRVAALLNHTEKRLDTMPDVASTRARQLVANIKSVLEQGDEQRLGQLQQQLTDLLFDVA